MKVSNALVCLDCDEIYSDRKACPKCGNRKQIPLRKWFSPMRVLERKRPALETRENA